uniref:Putative microcin peptide n=1 Tax=Helicobacter pylori TaxID=210 RepID=Q9F7U1_HELPX|nr:putative microcin peptide [Helicobacter pylori]
MCWSNRYRKYYWSWNMSVLIALIIMNLRNH